MDALSMREQLDIVDFYWKGKLDAIGRGDITDNCEVTMIYHCWNEDRRQIESHFKLKKDA